MKLGNKVKIILCMFLALIITRIVNNTVLLSNTPFVNKFFFARLRSIPSNFLASLTLKSGKKPAASGSYLTSSANRLYSPGSGQIDFDKYQSLPTDAMKPLAQGVYAFDDKGQNIIYIRVSPDMEWEEKQFEVNGHVLKVRIPKGSFQ